MNYQIATICLLLGLAAVHAQDSFCDYGTCVVIDKCPKLFKMLTTYPRHEKDFETLRNRNCGYEKRYPKVCCAPDEQIDGSQNANNPVNNNPVNNNPVNNNPVNNYPVNNNPVNNYPVNNNPVNNYPVNNNPVNNYPVNNNPVNPGPIVVNGNPENNYYPNPNVQNFNNPPIGNVPTRTDEQQYRTAISLLPSECGQDSSNRIIGGEATELDEFPWMALLEYRTQRGKSTSCGGVLISKRYVMTAAHCLKGAAKPASWRLTGVRLGEYNTATEQDCVPDGEDEVICADDLVTVGIEEEIAHESYSDNQLNDIALLRLARDVDFSNFVRPVCLPAGPLVRENFVVAGWGKTESRSDSDVKLKVALPLVQRPACVERYKVPLAESQICAGGKKGKDSCRGDSGGPLMQQNRRPGDNVYRWEAVGVVSFGPSPCGMEGWPGVYTNVSYHMPWILSKIRP